MSTLSEGLLQAVLTTLAAGNIGAPVERSRVSALERADLPYVVIRPKGSSYVYMATDILEHTLLVEVLVHVRGDVPDQLADPIVNAIHLALTADTTLGGKCALLLGPSIQWEEADSDGDSGITTLTYALHYLTDSRDLGRQV